MHKKTHNTINVWDPLIRIFHWLIATLFLIAYLTEDHWMTIHSYAGYCIGMLILFRLLWGLIGTKYARFSNFITTPANVISYLKQLFNGKAKHYLGHNPAGAAMIIALLCSLTLTILSGIPLFATEGNGPLANTFFASWSGSMLEEIHEFFANFTLFLVFFHVGGVLLSSLLHKENLIKSMINGRKQIKPQLTDKINHDS